MKKFLSIVLCAGMLLCAWAGNVSASEFDHSGYWPLLAAYQAAGETESREDDIAACKAIIGFYEDMADVISCQRLVSPCLKLARIYESDGLYRQAKAVYELLYDAQAYILEETGDDYGMVYLECILDQYDYIKPVVYAATADPENLVSFGAPGEPAGGTYTGMCDAYDESISSGILVYVEFITEKMKKYDFRVPQKKEGAALEIAWNIPNDGLNIEMFRAIAEGEYDEYIIENLTWLQGTVPDSVFLRFAAEVNCWGIISTYNSDGRLGEFVEWYIAAFRHVSQLRTEYAPKVAMVYSVTEVSNIYVDHTTFYPGDEYVDYVGVSAYNNMSSKAEDEWGSYTDAFSGIGKYENPITKMKRIVDSFEHKPILVTECGFCYESTKSEQTAEHSAKMLQYFYSYLNMVFPQVKGVFYFNTNFGGNSYKLFGSNLSAAHENAELYRSIMESNAGYSAIREGTVGGYTNVRSISEVTDSLELSVFASYPGDPDITVTYRWDGNLAGETATVPYSTVIPKESLTTGEHYLTVSVSCGTESYRYVYMVTVAEDGTVTVSVRKGDANLDGRVNLADVSYMLKHVAKWSVDIDMEAADTDDNSKVNLSDVSRVMKSIAGWVQA